MSQCRKCKALIPDGDMLCRECSMIWHNIYTQLAAQHVKEFSTPRFMQ